MESACGPLKEQQGTVICWILPIHPSTRAINRTQKQWPSREWSHTRTYGEAFNNLLREHAVHLLTGMGQKAVAPVFTPGWRIVETASGNSSTWSERHAAFAAGLGTFSLNDGFITEKGMAHRCGSVITDFAIPSSQRPYVDRAEYCLFCRDGRCGACIGRCPAQAISRNGHDKKKCFLYTSKAVVDAVGARYGVNALGCGLCQTGVPCESAIPPAKLCRINSAV
jgi:epoxyqueuosine reductase QueG